MEMPNQSATQEAKALNVKLEKEGDEWIAILPPHPDLAGDDEVGFPAPSEQEALDEARAFRSIEQSSVYKFEYDEKQDQYIVTFGKDRQAGKYLAPTYAAAQRAYAAMINQPEPPKAEEPPPPPAPKQRKRRAANGEKAPDLQIPQATAPDPRFTSGIGSKPGQLARPTQTHEQMRAEARQEPQITGQPNPNEDPWELLNKRITRLEDILHASLSVTAKALEELNKR